MNMNKSFSILTVAVLTLSLGLAPAFATHIEGEVENTSSLTLNGAWVTSEAANKFAKTTQPNSGDYSVGPTASSNTVSASQYFYERDSQTSVSWNANNIDFALSSLGVANMEYVIAVDGMSTSTMRGHITDAEEYFQIEHSINFVEDSSTSWTRSGNVDCQDLIDEVESDVNWSSLSANSDFLIAFVNVQMEDGNGNDIHACTDGVGGSTQSPVIVIGNSSTDYVRTIMHELTHDYEIDHEGASCTTQIPNIMAFGGTNGAPCSSSQYIKNWTPAQDDEMQDNRTWY